MILLIALLSATPGADGGVVLTRDLTGSDPGTFEQWVSSNPPCVPLTITPLFSVPGDGPENVAILMEPGLADSLTGGVLEQWAWDISAQCGEVLVAEASWSEPAEIRSWLAQEHASGLQGVIFAGDLPAAWAALDNAFLKDSETFPCDYFFMDLDGDWEDNWTGPPSAGNPGPDGIYDTWTGSDLDPEIWCGRIRTSGLSVGTEGALLQSYLERNHAWRTQGDPSPWPALCYVDNDWAVWGQEFAAAMQLLYPSVEMINDEKLTCGEDYEQVRLPFGYEWISPFVHSSPLLHQWNPGPETMWYEIPQIDPPTRFYNLFACSNARFTTPRNMGCMYTFTTSTGLAAIGSTKSGSMLSFEYFYAPLGQGASLGEGLEAWWQHIVSGGFTPSEMSWHLGMVLIGDPTLMPAYQILGIPGDGPAGPGPGFRVLANPVHGPVDMAVPGPGLVSVFDSSGRLVRSAAVEAGRPGLDLSGLPEGVYSLVFTDGTGIPSVGRVTLLSPGR